MSTRVDRDNRQALGESLPADYARRFDALASIRLPRPVRTVQLVVAASLAAITLFLFYTPWVQTAAGDGQVTALDPADRVQTITALAGGRIARWYVQEGSVVQKGDEIVEIVDLDPKLIQRLTAEQSAVASRYEAARAATQTALLNLERQRRLFDQGLASRATFERAQITYQEFAAKENAALADLNKAQINLSRQSTQLVTAPADGTVLQIRGGAAATLVNAGESLAQFVPESAQPAVEMFVTGLDASLVTPGRKVRLAFEGWPAVQAGGWPAIAVGTFGGVVTAVDPVVSTNGRFRVLVVEDPEDEPWPQKPYLRFGARARGWVLLDTVSVAYELWRRLNGFPPENATLKSGTTGGTTGR